MAVLEIASGILIAPFLSVIMMVLLLASFGKSFGIRRLYVKFLLRLFEFGRMNIEESAIRRKSVENESDSGEEEEEEEIDTSHKKIIDEVDIPKKNGLVKKLSQNGHMGNGNSVITKESLILMPDDFTSTNGINAVQTKEQQDNYEQINTNLDNDNTEVNSDKEETKPIDFKIEDCLEYIKSGMEAIIEDDVTSRFEAEELKNWNLLIRTNRGYEFISWKLTVLWFVGFLIRYLILMPLRVIICFIGVYWLTLCTAIVGWAFPEGDFKRRVVRVTLIHCFEFLSNAISSVVNYHNPENRPVNGICVANHTSPIDALVLMCDNCYSLIGQRHGGFLGILQRALARASPHIWFERNEAKDRSAVAARLRQHVSDPKNPPILIFPEGTCINNTSVMQFKKGSFEVGGVIYPVAIKYDARFGDAFWNSSRFSMMQYLYMMMTSWAIVCDVWYLPPMYREEDESAIDFANRVKSVIAKQGGLVDLMWDGQLKRMKAKKEWKELQQEKFADRLKGD